MKTLNNTDDMKKSSIAPMLHGFIIYIVLTAAVCLALSACSNSGQQSDLWENAIYTQDTELGSGAKTIAVEVKAEEKAVTFKINTDKKTVGDALSEHKLISGEKSAYGLYVKFVNGIEADYNKTKSFWAFSKNGESMMTGVDGEEITDGSHYEFVYTKQ
ncbi:MAG: DUF4430 domain-containing protein [Clostridia bacterium]|nr:DUF4430 domain-containing protein [Clostridia bacterium]